MSTEYVRESYGRIIGIIETDSSGVRHYKTDYGWEIGKYDPSDNYTRGSYNQILYQGDVGWGMVKDAYDRHL